MKKKILVTGSNGFVGSRLVSRLRKEGYEVFGLSRSKGPTTNLVGDVADWEFLEKFFNNNKIETIFHLASMALVSEGAENPKDTLRNNIEAAINILEAGRLYKTKRIIIASTSHVYGNNENVPYKEYYTPRPSRIYETSKTCADIIAQSYLATYDLPVYIARFTNIYGPGDMNFSRIIPKTMKSIVNNESPTVWGGDAVREYLYLEDAIDAYLKLMKVNMKKTKNHIFNFGTGKPLSVKELVKEILIATDRNDLEVIREKSTRKDEVKTQYVSWDKAKRILGWQPKHSLKEGLKETYLWYRNNI